MIIQINGWLIIIYFTRTYEINMILEKLITQYVTLYTANE